MKYDIFLSYSRSDMAVVNSILCSLANQGNYVFHDLSNEDFGEDFAIQISEYINQSKVVLLFLSNNSAKSAWVRREIEYAVSRKIEILPILLTGRFDFHKNDWYNDVLFKLNKPGIRYNPKNPDRTIDELVTCLNRIDAFGSLSDMSSDQKPDSDGKQKTTKAASSDMDESVQGNKSTKHKVLIAVISASILLFGIGIWYFLNAGRSSEVEYNKTISKDNDDIDIVSVLDSITEAIDTMIIGSHTVPDTVQYSQEILGKEADENNPEKSSSKIIILYFYFLIAFFAGFGLNTLLSRNKKALKNNVKLSSNIASKISIDGDVQKEIVPREVYSTHLSEGDYLIDFEDKNDEKRHQTYNHTVSLNECKLLFADFQDRESQEIKTIKCFIAGSITLQRERDALRAVTCVMYNKWESKAFRILSYTYEDFDRASVIDGHQKQYNDFIVNEADWALFIIDGELGEITLKEYRIAMSEYKQNGKPRILAMAKKGSDNNEGVAALLEEIRNENQYWSEYVDINELKHIFESTLNWDLIAIYH